MVRVYFPPGDRFQVQWLADHFDLVATERAPDDPDFHLRWVDGALSLHRGPVDRGVALRPSQYRRRASMDGDLARACGVKRGARPRVLDAMAGIGLDGMTLVELGCPVVMVEKTTSIWALLADHVRLCEPPRPVVIHADAWSWLQRERTVFDVVYLDPMFPARRKGALPGKSMQYLAALAAADSRPLTQWIALGRKHATQRVVVKRRLRDATAEPPDWQIRGSKVRFDVYRGIAT